MFYCVCIRAIIACCWLHPSSRVLLYRTQVDCNVIIMAKYVQYCNPNAYCTLNSRERFVASEMNVCVCSARERWAINFSRFSTEASCSVVSCHVPLLSAPLSSASAPKSAPALTQRCAALHCTSSFYSCALSIRVKYSTSTAALALCSNVLERLIQCKHKWRLGALGAIEFTDLFQIRPLHCTALSARLRDHSLRHNRRTGRTEAKRSDRKQSPKPIGST